MAPPSARKLLAALLAVGTPCLVSAVRCVCNGESHGRGRIGTKCASWDAPDEKPWCYVDASACGTDTFESRAGVHWAHQPCAGVSAAEALDNAAPRPETAGGGTQGGLRGAKREAPRGGGGAAAGAGAGASPNPVYLPCRREPARRGASPDGDFMLGATEFLPDPVAADAVAAGADADADADAGADADADADAVAFRVAWRRNAGLEQRCEDDVPPPKVGMANWCYYGTGACFHSMAGSLDHAFQQDAGVMLVSPKIQEGEPTAFCKQASMYCYIREPINALRLPPAKRCTAGRGAQRAETIAGGSPAGLSTLPARFAHRSRFWYVAQLMHAVFQLNARFKAHVGGIIRRIGFRHPIIGMQVRHGDTCRVREVCWPLETFMVQARRMRDKYGVSRIFLATDSDKIAAEARGGKYAKEGFEFIVQSFNRSAFDIDTRSDEFKHLHPNWNSGPGNFDTVHAAGLSNANLDVQTIMTDVELLARSDFMVSAFSTNVARLAYELNAARRSCLVPFVSVDIPWCHNNGQAMGKKFLTEKNMRWQYTAC